MPGTAWAAPADGDLPLQRPCVLTGSPNASAEALIKSPHRFSCSRDPKKAEGATIWVRYDLSGHAIEGSTGWTYDHSLIQARDERVWIAYADGRVRQSITDREDARQVLGGHTQRYAFPEEPGQIVALLARVDDLQNRRGPVPRASLTSHDRTARNLARYYLVFGLMAGVMFGILFYNLTLYVALKYRMLAAYCCAIACTLFYGIVGSNVILAFAPGISTASQYGWHAFSISLGFLSTGYYMLCFLEDRMVPRRMGQALLGLGMVAVAVSATRIFGEIMPWQVFDGIIYTLYIAIIALIFAGSFVALRRGSRAVHFFALAWVIPLAIIVARILWGIGAVPHESAIFDSSTFIGMCAEALLSSIGLSWRLRTLRQERDQAEDRADQFYDMAHNDPLTGLLNRRAFLNAVLGAKTPRTLLIVDIDHFKSINDTWGHDRGDVVLRQVAQALRDAVPAGAAIGRLGGEEFAIVCGAGAAATMGQQVRLAVSVAASWPERHVTCSIGAADGLIEDEGDWRSLYVLADKALYMSKHAGRDRVTLSNALATAA